MRGCNEWKRIARIAAAVAVVALVGCEGAEDRMAAHLNKGIELYERGEDAKAGLEFKNVLQIDPTHVEARLLLAKVDERRQRWSRAIGHYRRIIDLAPEHVEAHVRLGQLYLLGGLVDQAGAMADAAIAIRADDPDALVLRGSLAARDERLDAALADGQAALSSSPEHASAVALVASVLVRLERFDEAVRLLESYLQAHPNATSLKTLLARIHSGRGERDKAIALFTDVVDALPNELEHRLQLSALYGDNGQVDEGERVLRDGVERDQNAPAPKLALAEFLVKHGKAEQAISVLDEFVRSAEDPTELRFGLADLYERQSRPDDAAREYRAIIEANGLAPQGLAARTALAALLLEQGRNERAASLVEEVIEENARDRRALTLRARLSLANGDVDAAIADLRTVLRDDPNEARVLLALAGAHAAKGEFQRARDYTRRAAEASPRNPDVRMAYADLLMRLGEQERAIVELERSLEVSPQHEATRVQLVRLLILARRWDAAAAQVQALRAEAPRDGRWAYLAGVISQGRGDLQASIADFESALERGGGPEVLSALIASFLALGDEGRALARLDAIIERAPDSAIVHNLRGEVLAAQRDFDRASESFRRAIALKPNWGLPYRNLGATYLSLGDDDGAVKVFEEGLIATSRAPSLVFALASRYEKLNNPELAINQYEELLERDPELHAAANNLAMLLVTYNVDQARLDRAMALTERFVDSSNPAYMDTRGWIHYKRGEYERARVLLERVVALEPEVAEYRYHLAMLYRSQGETERARDNLERALAAGTTFRGIDEARAALRDLRGATASSG